MNDFDQKPLHGQPANISIAAELRANDSCAIATARLGPKHTPQLPAALRADCSRCAGLCCVVHAFYAVQGFAFDKPAHSACRYLTSQNQCAIHSGLAARGFPGCLAFDCYGAGQRVSRELCNNTGWRGLGDAERQSLFSAYTTCLALHRLMAVLVLTEATAAPALAAQMRLKRSQLNELCCSEKSQQGSLDVVAHRREVATLVRQAADSINAQA